jgi:cytoskeleton protein RodZ
MPATPFGEHLKREREMRGVSLEEISAATRISTRFLEAIESEQWDQLPGGVFNRGFIRSIARFLGLDEDGLVAEYALETKREAEKLPAASPPTEIPRNWRLVVAISFLGAILIAGLAVYLLFGAGLAGRFHRKGSGALPGTVAGSPARMPAASGGTDAGKGVPATSGESSAPVAGGLPPPGALPALALKVEAGKPAQLKVIADGKTVFEGAVRANVVMNFNAKATFEVTTSDFSALLLELNGQPVPPIGPPGQLGKITLTQNDLKSVGEVSH